MSLSFFLGGNTKDGFYSLYNDFAKGQGEYLHIIKGGPGTGKSGFMRSIAHAAQLRGMEVQFVICSGDPNSIDGVFIPRLGEGWVDGTAPHISEARHFGFDSDYVNLSEFFVTDFNDEDFRQVKELTRAYKACYGRAYAYLKMAAGLDELSFIEPMQLDKDLIEELYSIVNDASVCKAPSIPCCKKIFLSSICCQGRIILNESFSTLCKLIYSVEGSGSYVNAVLKSVETHAEALGLTTVSCLSPLNPSRLEAVLLPTHSVGFVSAELRADNARPLKRAHDEPQRSETEQRELRRTSAMRGEALSMAIGRLREAKAFHDRLEAYYIRQMDFSALTAFTNELVDSIFDRI